MHNKYKTANTKKNMLNGVYQKPHKMVELKINQQNQIEDKYQIEDGNKLKNLKNRILSVFEFNEFKPRLKSPRNWFRLSAGLNLEKFNTNLSGTNKI